MFKNEKLVVSICLGLSLVGCGSSGEKESAIKPLSTPQVVNNPQVEKSSFESNETKEDASYVVGYVTKSGVLIETKSDGSQLFWVNAHENNENKISAPDDADRDGKTVYEAALAHCNKLADKAYVNVTTWRLPTVEEATHVMDVHNGELLIFPSNDVIYNPYMATDKEGTFVLTTSQYNSAYDVGNSFESQELNKEGTVGVRCVANR